MIYTLLQLKTIFHFYHFAAENHFKIKISTKTTKIYLKYSTKNLYNYEYFRSFYAKTYINIFAIYTENPLWKTDKRHRKSSTNSQILCKKIWKVFCRVCKKVPLQQKSLLNVNIVFNNSTADRTAEPSTTKIIWKLVLCAD